jgi:hypothetical protein
MNFCFGTGHASVALSTLESVIPPEAPTPSETEIVGRGGSDGDGRFAELVGDTLLWNPDQAPEGRLSALDTIQLDIRGLTSHPDRGHAQPTSRQQQTEFWKSQTAQKNSVAAKLRTAGLVEEASRLEHCHSYYTVAQCGDCGAVRKFPNRCDRFYCPECQPALSHERRRQVEWWVGMIKQPKHVVLTVRNIPDLTRGHVDQLQDWFGRLRRRKFCRDWRGGFYSIELTNEGQGWHLHIHALVDADWIDSAGLALAWDNTTNGMGRIVSVSDCREKNYLAEVTKYAVKGSMLAKWSAGEIATFVRAFQGKRTFGVFGNLYAARTEFAEWIATLKACKPKCPCGSCNVSYFDELTWESRALQPTPAPRPPPQPAPAAQSDLIPAGGSWPD